MKRLKLSNYKYSKPKFSLPKKPRQTYTMYGNRKIHHGQSLMEQRWIQKLGVPISSYVIKLPGGKFCIVDGYDPKTNTIYEFLGSFYHGDIRIYDPDKYNTFLKKYNRELYLNTIDRFRLLYNLGYKIFFQWELDEKKNTSYGRYFYYYDKNTNKWDNLY